MDEEREHEMKDEKIRPAAPKYRAVLFDLDGVICHTDRYHYRAWKELADGIGVYFDEKINERLRGVSRMESLEIILERCPRPVSHEEKERLAAEKNARYRTLLAEMTPEDVTPEVRGTLDHLREGGVRLAIGSSSKNARFILEQIGLGDYFDAISDGNNISRSKPDPEVFVKAAQFVGEKPGDCLVVEDAEAGLAAAAAGGMDSAGIGPARTSDKATYGLEHFSDLLGVVLG